MIKACRKLLWIVVMGMGFIQSSFALQMESVAENGEVNAAIAVQDLTRIAVEHDRIVHVRGLEGAYELKHDPHQGALFIRPTPDYQAKSFTLFIATEQNHNYVLHLTPKEQWGDTILLKPQGMKKPKALHGEPYTKKLVDLMTHMIKGSSLPHYAMDTFARSRWVISQELTVKLIRLYSGTPLQGYVFCITNYSAQTLKLTEGQFYHPGDCAIALSQLTVAPGDHFYLYKVSR